MRIAATIALLTITSSAMAEEVASFSADLIAGYDIVIIGEVHDAAEHHILQADIITSLSPTAVVFEMLNPSQAALVTDDTISDPDLGDILGWEAAGWPDFEMYAPVIAASSAATIVGAAAPDSLAAQAREDSLAAFGDQAEKYGLLRALPVDQQTVREQGMQDSHCGALPAEMLPWFVDQQRFRDAVFARASLAAFEELGGPVVVITGNGHARQDWGMPVYLASAAPDVSVLSIGQITYDDANAPFDLWRVTDPVDRPDPCAAFK